ncbi:olfactory receptor 4A47-like [Castor canadensis]|uniref:Olfactory receptor n=1 Tax=Castor canadensis TaxID=51338 RepID=A0A8C0W9D7_CASCN|nr:olfactory receptor 4A47-like [Castor canadensis]
MEPRNNVTYFVLMGLTQNPKEQKILFVIFLLFYILSFVGNLLTIMTITLSQNLASPMYFFLASLSFLDIIYSSTISPQLLSDLCFENSTISFKSCMIQLFTEHLFGGSEICLLLVMAYDRYVAICKPLHYLVIMKQRMCVVLLIVSWVGGFLHSVIQLVTIYGLPFCGPNVIDHFMCDMYPLLELVCVDTYVIGILVVVNGGLMCVIVFLLLLISYGVILYSLKNLSQEGRRKALSTCGSHIAVVVCFFGPCIFMYARPAKTFPTDKSLSVFYTVITPMLNPLIYTLRNSEMTNAMKKLCRKKFMSGVNEPSTMIRVI